MSEFVFPYETAAIQVTQPLGQFYVIKLPASLLLKVTFSDLGRIKQKTASGLDYLLRGGQRRENPIRKREIEAYIRTVEAAFPNSIILGANYDGDGNLVNDEAIRWKVQGAGEFKRLIIPSEIKLASIIDGQHRLHAFEEVEPRFQEIELLCAVYLDLPNPYKAYLFATINFNQKRVDRSLAYDFFGFDLDNEPEISWSPDKAAVNMARRLNLKTDSPLYGHIAIAVQDDAVLSELQPNLSQWKVSMATVVDGILRLFSASPKQDKAKMHLKTVDRGRNRLDLSDDGTPFRQLYRQTNDLAIVTAIENYFIVVRDTLWTQADERSYIRKTVGIQALFDVMREIMKSFSIDRDISQAYFRSYLEKVGGADFSSNSVQASGIGRAYIRSEILRRIGLTV